jgi:CRISPR system Cascade subunit CasD
MSSQRTTLLLRLSGPMQAWGTQSRFTVRDTGMEPSFSGVLGLLCAALGRARDEPLDDLAQLTMGVRVDREGLMRVDYHTAGGAHLRTERHYGVPGPDGSKRSTVVSRRYYLADAEFLVGLEGERSLLDTLQSALRSPRWPLFLGRKSFVPSAPVYLPDAGPWGPGIRSGELEEVLREYPWLGEWTRRRNDRRPRTLRLVLSDPTSPDVRADIPLSFAERRFATRSVRTSNMPVPDWNGEDDVPLTPDPRST